MNNYLIFETDYFTVSQTSDYRVPGYVIILSKAPFTHITEFTPEQAGDLVRCLANAEAIVQQIIEPERIYIMKFGEVNPRIHFHVFPRTSRIATAYEKAVEDKPPYNGARVVDWIWNNHESLGFTNAEIEAFAEEARKNFRQRNISPENIQ